MWAHSAAHTRMRRTREEDGSHFMDYVVRRRFLGNKSRVCLKTCFRSSRWNKTQRSKGLSFCKVLYHHSTVRWFPGGVLFQFRSRWLPRIPRCTPIIIGTYSPARRVSRSPIFSFLSWSKITWNWRSKPVPEAWRHKRMGIGKEKIKLSLFTDNTIAYIENTKESIEHLLKLISDFRKS